MKLAKLVAFEGIDGSGKTSLVEAVRAQLEARGRRVLVVRDCSPEESIGALLRAERRSGQDPHSYRPHLYLLAAAARAKAHREVVAPAMTSADVILFDRYTQSSLAYAGATFEWSRYGRWRLYPEPVLELVRGANASAPRPDAAIVLDLDPDAAFRRAEARAEARGEVADDFERSRVLAQRVAAMYRLPEVDSYPVGGTAFVQPVDAAATVEVACSIVELSLSGRAVVGWPWGGR